MRCDDPRTEARLRRAAEGDELALRWLLERHRPRLRWMIAGRLAITEGVVRVRHIRTLQRITPLLGAPGGEPEP
jgi:hypothetical protein